MEIRSLTAIAVSAVLAASNLSITPAPAVTSPQSALLDISQFTVRDENLVYLGTDYLRSADFLFDDQDKVPASPDSLSVSTETWEATSRKNWQPNQQTQYGGASFYIDFGANYVVTAMAFLDTNGTPNWTVSTGEPFSWNKVADISMDWYNSWRSVTFDDPQPTRYMYFTSDYCDSGVSELALYGYKVSDLTPEQTAKTAPKSSSETAGLTAGKAVGFNAFIDDPLTAIMAGGNIREYHNFSWLLDATGKVKFTQGTWGDMDSFYTMLHDRGIEVIPCFQAGSSVISGASDSVPEIPVPAGADTLDPASYAVHAQAMYQVAARYGSNKNIDMSTLNITDAQEAKVGMGLLTALENSNEPNKNWSGKANYFTPYELAAMCSADYDGHEGTIPNAGVKTADPDFKLAMGGLVGYSTMLEYLDEMKLWFDYNRTDGRFAVDIINVHIGPDDFNVDTSSFRDTINALQDWIDRNAPGTELWISEFEVPMNDCVTDGVDNHDNEKYQLRYAQRVARTYLIALSEGVDRITKFQLRDEGAGVYGDSGLVTVKGEWSKKQAWYALSCMSNVLKNADLTADKSADGLCILEFTDRLSGNIIKCLWSPTNEDKTVRNYTVSAEGAQYAYLTVPDDTAEGALSQLTISGGNVILDVGETPVYLTLTGKKREIISGRSQMLRPALISLDTDKTSVTDLNSAPDDAVLGQFYRMFDEPDTMPDPAYGDTMGLSAPETNVNRSGITAYAYFDKPYTFNAFAVYDTYGTGNISVYDAYSDRLLWSSDLGSYMSRSIDLATDSAPTDCLKIVKQSGDLNELAFYGYYSAAQVEYLTWDVDRSGIIDIMDQVLMGQHILENDGMYTDEDFAGLRDFLLGK